jgi:hypothetical protein
MAPGAEKPYQRQEDGDGLLRGVQLVPGVVGKLNHIADGVGWLLRLALGQQESSLMLVAHKARP